MTTALIDIRSLTFKYSPVDSWSLLVSELLIEKRSFYSLLGNNMSGKTTLLRLIFGLERIPARKGSNCGPLLSGELISGRARRWATFLEVRPKETTFLSHSDRMFPELSLWDNVRVIRQRRNRLTKKEAKRRFDHYLDDIPVLRGKSTRSLSSLSSGGQALVRLARSYVWSSQLVLIDEVTAHLDDRNATVFFSQLEKLMSGGCSVVLVSHLDRDHKLGERAAKACETKYVPLLIRMNENQSCLERR